jgi:hypothetical protein
LVPRDGKAHTYETLFHLDAENASADGLRVATQNAGPNLTVLAFGADSVKIVKGLKNPVVQGWLPDDAGGYGGIRPIPTAVYRKEASGNVALLYVLSPTGGAAACRVKSVELLADRLTLRLADSSEKTIKFQRLAAQPTN